jgi:beta-N-acetylhexosaminidase
VAIDQEGGEVERLPGLAPDAAPAELGASGDEAAALREGRATGRDLRRLGVNVDLAPVLDVPATTGAFITTRAFGTEPAAVSALGIAFARGLMDAGVAATAKHFPGLGTATVNTDEAPSALDASRAQLAAELGVFEAAIDAGVPLVMVANATYAALDPNSPASLSRRVIEGQLRRRLGFGGVVITDDLGAGALTSLGVDEAEAAVSASAAGADLLLFALTDGEAAATALVDALRRGELERRRLEESCVRTVALRERLG